MPGGKSERPPVLFLHDADVTPGHVGALRELDRVLALDVPRHPGFGADDDLAESWDSVSDLAQFHIERVRRSPDVERVHLMGAGFGGWVALEMALRARELFLSLVLISPYGVKVMEPTDAEFADLFVLEPDELIALSWSDPARVEGVRIPGYPDGSTASDNARAFADRAALARYGWRPFMHDPKLARWIGQIDLPALVVGGADDRMLTPGHDGLVAERLPAAEYVEIQSAGHYCYIESPDAFTNAVLDFFQEHDFLEERA